MIGRSIDITQHVNTLEAGNCLIDHPNSKTIFSDAAPCSFIQLISFILIILLKWSQIPQYDQGPVHTLCAIIYSTLSATQNQIITYSVLISHCFALHAYEKHELIKPEWVIVGLSVIL